MNLIIIVNEGFEIYSRKEEKINGDNEKSTWNGKKKKEKWRGLKVAGRENAKLVSTVNKGGGTEIRDAEFDESKEADEETGEWRASKSTQWQLAYYLSCLW